MRVSLFFPANFVFSVSFFIMISVMFFTSLFLNNFLGTRFLLRNRIFSYSKESLSVMFLGDSKFAYRYSAIALQNMASLLKRSSGLSVLSYSDLFSFIFAVDGLDPTSDLMPSVVMMYSDVRHPNNKFIVANYLVHHAAGSAKNWRYYVDAVSILSSTKTITADNAKLIFEIGEKMIDIGHTVSLKEVISVASLLKDLGEKCYFYLLLNKIRMVFFFDGMNFYRENGITQESVTTFRNINGILSNNREVVAKCYIDKSINPL